jgi:hypothetical protein
MHRLVLSSLAFGLLTASTASAVAFPSLTTIYIGTGLAEAGSDLGPSTIIQCSNVSGVTASLRFLVLDLNGAVKASKTTSVVHGAAVTAATKADTTITGFFEDVDLATGDVLQGTINIEATQSAIFCNAMVLGFGSTRAIPLPLVRVNAHPGAAG